MSLKVQFGVKTTIFFHNVIIEYVNHLWLIDFNAWLLLSVCCRTCYAFQFSANQRFCKHAA